MCKQIRWLWLVLLGIVVLLAACGNRPMGIEGQIAPVQDAKIQVVKLESQGTGGDFQVYVEGPVVAEPALDEKGAFHVSILPGNYLIKVFSLQDELLAKRKVQVKRNKMTRIKIELE